MRKLSAVCLVLLSSFCNAETREIAITIDDLPLVASRMDTKGNQQRSIERFDRIIDAFKAYQVPVTGFVIAGAIEKGQWAFLEKFRAAGFELGNHTYSHRSLNQIGAERYIEDVARADKVLTPILTEPKYFRYPYLAEGNQKSKPLVQNFLAENHYKIAPVTIDTKDFQFNEQLYKVPFRSRESYINHHMKKVYLDYVWQATLKAERRAKGKPVKQILLIHSNVLNSYVLPDLLKMYKDNGYTFISLDAALKNPAPAINVSPKEKAAPDGVLMDMMLPNNY